MGKCYIVRKRATKKGVTMRQELSAYFAFVYTALFEFVSVHLCVYLCVIHLLWGGVLMFNCINFLNCSLAQLLSQLLQYFSFDHHHSNITVQAQSKGSPHLPAHTFRHIHACNKHTGCEVNTASTSKYAKHTCALCNIFSCGYQVNTWTEHENDLHMSLHISPLQSPEGH